MIGGWPLWIVRTLAAGLLGYLLRDLLQNRVPRRYIVAACFALVAAAVGLDAWNERVTARAPVFVGSLEPGNDPLPASVAGGRVALSLGDALMLSVPASSKYQLRCTTGEVLVEISQTTEQRINLTASVLDSTGRHIVQIFENEFQASHEAAFSPKKPDAHSLVVRDMSDVEVLNLRYQNPRAMYLTGRFALPHSGRWIEITRSNGLRLDPRFYRAAHEEALYTGQLDSVIRGTSTGIEIDCAEPSATVSANAPSIPVLPSRVVVGPGEVLSFYPKWAAGQSVFWRVVERDGGTIDERGLYTAPSRPGTYHIVVSDVTDPSVTTTAAVTVSPTTN